MERLRMRNIDKSFFGVKVLSDVSLSLEAGEVHALLGENGAGKSTLMNILGGVLERDGGTIELDGQALARITPGTAAELGIAFVHQELNLINDLRVYENIFLGEELTGPFRCLDKRRMADEVRKLFDSLGVSIDPRAMVGDLDTSSKQLLEIAKALRRDARLFILDEPTTALGTQEIDHLFTIVNRLKRAGKSFIFISHKMPEVFALADRYTVLRNGKFMATGNIADTTPLDVTRMMVGESYDASEVYAARDLGEPVLELRGLTGAGFADIGLCVRRGEIFGLTGLQGSGCSELMRCLFGLTRPASGEITLFGKRYLPRDARAAMRNRIAMLPSNRKENSILPDMTLVENSSVSKHVLSGRKPLIHKAMERAAFAQLARALGIAYKRPEELIVNLSGGNQQKVILARWLGTDADIFLFDNPTQGIDVGAKAEIYKLIVDLSRQGKTVLVNTLEIGEIQRISDRCAVLYHGRLQIVLDRASIDEKTVMFYATNANSITPTA